MYFAKKKNDNVSVCLTNTRKIFGGKYFFLDVCVVLVRTMYASTKLIVYAFLCNFPPASHHKTYLQESCDSSVCVSV